MYPFKHWELRDLFRHANLHTSKKISRHPDRAFMKEFATILSFIVFLLLCQFWISKAYASNPASTPYQKAAACMEANDFDGAVVHAKEMLATARTNHDRIASLVLLSDAATQKHDYPTSIQSMNKAIALADKSDLFALSCFQWTRGRSYYGNKEFEKAISDYNAVEPVRKEPRDVVNLMRDRALVYEKLHQNNKSILDLTRAIKFVDSILGSKAVPAMISRVRGDKIGLLYSRAKLLDLVGKPDDAKRDKAMADKLTDEW